MFVSFESGKQKYVFSGFFGCCFVIMQVKFLLAECLKAIQNEEVELFVALSHCLIECFLC